MSSHGLFLASALASGLVRVSQLEPIISQNTTTSPSINSRLTFIITIES
jgi:hypothetical protein